MKKRIVALLVMIIVLLLVGSYHLFSKEPKIAEINGHKFFLELADSKDEREKGLSGREKLCSECGMLFIFPQKGTYNFWMRGMRFDLDIIWINDGKISAVKKNISHNDEISMRTGAEADRVLEINAGLAEKYGLKEGDQVRFSY